MKNFIFLVALWMWGQFASAQVLQGTVLDKSTKEPLPFATVYIDGTTISTTTNEDGQFSIDAKGFSSSQLVISYVGYITSRLDNVFQHKKIVTHLEQDAVSIPEVVVGRSPFTRKRMLEAFRKEFLGRTKAGSRCKILNEDDIHLFYDMEKNTLFASAQKTLKVKNPELDYVVYFDLVDFAVQYNAMSIDDWNITNSFFFGTTFYQDVSKKGNANKKRIASYKGSIPHLVRTIAENSWDKEGFKVGVDKFLVDPKEYFAVKDTVGFKQIKLIKQPIKTQPEFIVANINGVMTPQKTGKTKEVPVNFTIVYNVTQTSILKFSSNELYVDENGNYTPMTSLVFGGVLGQKKLGDMLPTNYYQENKDKL